MNVQPVLLLLGIAFVVVNARVLFDYLVIGQPIREAANPVLAAREVVAAMERGLSAPDRRGREAPERPTE